MAAVAQNSAVSKRWIGIGFAIAILAIIGGTIGWAVYSSQVGPYERPVVRVDDREVAMGYFIARTALKNGDPLEMLDTLVREEVLAIEAAKPPYNIAPTDAAVDAFLRRAAVSGTSEISDVRFDAWYRQRLNESRMSEPDFRRAARLELIRSEMTAQFAGDLPDAVPQVHLHMLPVQSLEEANRIRALITGPDEFAEAAAGASIDPGLRESRGDAGWMPREALSDSMAAVVFDELAVGEVSEPLSRVDRPGFVLVMATEKSANRTLDPAAARRIGANRLETWLTEVQQNHEVQLKGLENGYDSVTDAWVRQEVTRLRASGTLAQ